MAKKSDKQKPPKKVSIPAVADGSPSEDSSNFPRSTTHEIGVNDLSVHTSVLDMMASRKKR